MAEATLPEIRRFLSTKRLAMAGVSRNEKHFSRALYRSLQDRGYEVVPVNPQAAMIGDERCYPRVSSIEPPVDAVLVMTPAKQTAAVCEDCLRAGIARIWMYRAIGHGAVDKAAAERCREAAQRPLIGREPDRPTIQAHGHVDDDARPRGAHGKLPARRLRQSTRK